MTLKEHLELRERQWRAFHEWEEAQPLVERDPAECLAAVGRIYSWLPPEVRAEDPDPGNWASRRCAALALLKR